MTFDPYPKELQIESIIQNYKCTQDKSKQKATHKGRVTKRNGKNKRTQTEKNSKEYSPPVDRLLENLEMYTCIMREIRKTISFHGHHRNGFTGARCVITQCLYR